LSVRAAVVAPASPEAVWARWSDVATWPEWNPHCASARLDGPLAPGTRLELEMVPPVGRAFVTRPRLVAVEAPRVLAWEARGLGLRAPTRSELAEDAEGTLVTIDSDVTGALAFTYRLTLPEQAQALMFTGMLNALVSSLR
jgi:uncharacterized protein YndB with AHSA1/START domain